MPEVAELPVAASPKRGWFRRALRWLGFALLFVVVFHRPLFHLAAPFALHLVAARMHLDLSLHTSGNIFTTLNIENVHARANGGGPTPIRSIEIGSVNLEYSIPSLLRGGIGEFVHSYEIHRANLDLVALPSATEKDRKEKVQIAKLLNDILGQPAAYADRVWIEDFSITVTAPQNVTEVKNFHLRLDPDRAGWLRVGVLAVPGAPRWENLDAVTSYTSRNFFIRELRLGPELVLREINFDASQRAQNKGGMSVKADAFGGTLLLQLSGEQLHKKGENLDNAYASTLKLEIAGVALDRAAAYFGAPAPPVTRLTRLAVAFTGEPEKPRTWRGDLAAQVESIAAGAVKIDAASLAARFGDGRAEITGVNANVGRNIVKLTATVGLPGSVNDFPKSDVDARLTIDAPELAALAGAMPDPLTGTITGGGPIVIRDGRIRADLALEARDLANKDLALPSAKVAIQATKQFDPAPPGPFDGLDGRVTAEVGTLRMKTVTIDSARLDLEARNRLVKLNALEVRRGENVVEADGSARIPEDAKLLAKTPLDARFKIHLPSLGDFGIAANDQILTGRLEGDGAIKLVDGVLDGGVKLDGGAFKLGGFTAERLAAKVNVAGDVVNIDQLALQLNGTDQVVAAGKAGIAKPFAYEGGLLVSIKNLSALQPLLAVFGQTQPIAGALDFQWNGKGTADPQSHSGEVALGVAKAKYGTIDLSEVQFGGLYTPEFAESKPFRIVAGATSLGGVLEFREGKLRLKDLKFEQGGVPVLSGYVFLPFDPANAKQPIALDQRIAANINTDKLDVEKLLASFGQASPVSGAFTANVVAGGTLREPFAHLKVAAERLQAKAAKQFDPGALALELHYSNKELTLNATVKQPQIQPLTIRARAPFDLDATIESKKLDPALPIEATAQLPASSLAFVPKVAPLVRRIDGTAGLDLRIGGTVSQPEISGGLDVELTGARMTDENIPGIGAFRAKLAFAEKKLTFQTFEGEVGGGKFKLGGAVNLTDMKNPVFALHLESDEVLVKRDDSITLRADADVKLDGPLNAAAVTGAVYVVHSRFFREIDILPIALPGKPKPAPKTASAGPTTVSIPQPPVRDWKFDLALKTRENDPFLIRGNLANGAVSLNLKLGGTGLAPYLEGSAKIERFVASLPFSTLSITSGFLAFTKDLPFQPSMEIQAESAVRDYRVHAFIYGKATEPQVQLNSEPPLPHADIVSLLATGTTTSELAGSADALASRAAMLAVKQLYQKVFKRGSAPPAEEKSDSGSFMDRFQVELGALSNRSGGGQDVKARYKFNDQVYLTGDIGVDGNFTGSLKYLIRFR
jgi:autotransporter translocation and assembly factor TamB